MAEKVKIEFLSGEICREKIKSYFILGERDNGTLKYRKHYSSKIVCLKLKIGKQQLNI
jgi:hypothetical protein